MAIRGRSNLRSSSGINAPILEASATPAPQSGQAGARTRAVVAYLVLALLALVPGVMLKLGLRTGNKHIDALLDALSLSLQDIRFGSGLRFWLGVTGATMMGLLLLYPLRKAFSNSAWIGRMAGWFNIHIVFGIAGPVLILYHTNFGTGSANANVALWTMLAVAISGGVGHFIYASVSAAFYAQKHRARDQLEAIITALQRIEALPVQRGDILADLQAFDAALLTPRRGVIASFAARVTLERRRAFLARAISTYLGQATLHLGLDDAVQERLRRTIAHHFGSYMRIARGASSRSVREQLWARWRLFHLPVFLIMIAAAGLHIAAVWNMDAPEGSAAVPIVIVAAPVPVAVPPPQSVLRPAPAPINTSKPSPRPLSAPAFDLEPRLVGEPKPASRPTVSRQSIPSLAEQSPIPGPAPPVDAAASGDMSTVYAELQRRTGEAPMALGGVKLRPLAEQIALFKARQKTGAFSHNDAQTGFALTGKHTGVECATCHTKPLRETRQSDQRTCVACHQTDDVHRGRRPDCGRCHTPSRWGDIIRRK